MKSKAKTIFNMLVVFILTFKPSVRGHSINMILSFLIQDERPSNLLIPNLCWNLYKQKALAKSLSDANIGIASSLQYNRSEYHLQYNVVMVDLGCPGAEWFLRRASKEGFFKAPYRWLLLSVEETLETEVFDNTEILVDSDVTVAQQISNQEYLLTEAYKISEKSPVIFTKAFSWLAAWKSDEINMKTSLQITAQTPRIVVNKHGLLEDYRDSKVLSSRRRDLNGHTLTMANVITDSNETRKHMDDRLNLHQDCITKMSYAVVQICFQMLNATERLLFTHTWGYRDKNGIWQGIVDHLIKKEADLGTLTIFTEDRMMAVDYIAMVGTTAVRFVFRKPPLSYISNIFAMPFSGSVWLAIFICVLGCALVLYFTSKWEASMGMVFMCCSIHLPSVGYKLATYELLLRTFQHPLQLDGSWADVLILVIGGVLQQGCTLEPRFAAGRCVTLLLFVALTILYAAYSANVVVLLRAPSSAVTTLPDLLNYPLKVGASDFEYNRYFFKKLNEPIRKAIYEKKIAPKGKKPNFYSMEEGVERIRKGLFAFHMELNPGYRLIQETYQEDEKCDLVEIDYINEIDPWIPGQKRSPFKDLFKINFLKIRESGVQANIHRQLTVARPSCSGSLSTFSSVGITDMYPAMLITVYGMLLAPAVLLMEIAYKRLMMVRERKKLLAKEEDIPFHH